MSISSGVRSNNQHASASSRPLFASVAESTEIFCPIDQLGCAHASSGVTLSNDCRDLPRKGPPEAVRTIFSTLLISGLPDGSIGKHWCMALCSLSTGSRVAPPCFTASIKRLPALTSASLLASKMVFPDLAALSVGRNPANPTIPATTVSMSGADTNSSNTAAPAATVTSGTSSSAAFNASAAASSPMTAY